MSHAAAIIDDTGFWIFVAIVAWCIVCGICAVVRAAQ